MRSEPNADGTAPSDEIERRISELDLIEQFRKEGRTSYVEWDEETGKPIIRQVPPQ